MERDWKARAQSVGTWMFGAAAAIFLGVLALWIYMSANARPLHPAAQDIPSVRSGTPPPAWHEAVERGRQLVRAHLAEKNLPGVSIAVGVNGTIVWDEGFGWANLEKQNKVSPDTQFRIGTASMALTSAAVGALVDRNRLDFDDEIRTHVPEFPAKPWPVTLRQLMAQTAGVRSDGGDEGPFRSLTRCEKPVEGLRYFASEPLLFEPGTKFRRSIYGWILVSAAIEAASDGEPFLSVMQKEIFAPLGMTHTRADSGPAAMPDRATSYFPKFASDPRYGPDVMDPVDYSCYAGASVFVSTASDMVRFGMGLAKGGLLKPATVKELQTSQRLRSGEETGYGLGWDVGTATLSGAQTAAIGHDGNVMGGKAVSFLTFPQYGVSVAVLSNISYAKTHDLAVKIAEPFASRGGR